MSEPPPPSTAIRRGLLGLIIAVATLLRTYQLGRLSYWYDEVVTIRLARTPDPARLLDLLGRIDATRAPLHPLLLQQWVKAFGPSEAAGRGFSVVCGVLTVVMIERLGRRMLPDGRTGLWAALLAAFSPLLLVYSRETRMYAWLVLVTCICWDALLSLNLSPAIGRSFVYAMALAALVYSHPLGLLMALALGLASLANRQALGLSWRRWGMTHLVAGLMVAPWIGHYFDHDPESTLGRLPLRFLFGLPIGFLGGNFLTLIGIVALIAFGLFSREKGKRIRLDDPGAASCLLIWLTIPPVLLYAYSSVSHPVFGPARYTLYVAPAFLILVGRGLAKLPGLAAWAVAATALVLSMALYPSMVFNPDLKADWRGAARLLDRLDPGRTEPVVVVSTDLAHNVEVETARYYLGPARRALEAPGDLTGGSGYWVAVGLRGGKPTIALPASVPEDVRPLDLAGLRLIRVAK